MVVDHLENVTLYHGLGDRIAAGLSYLAETDFGALGPGRYELDGERLYAMVQQYDTEPGDGGSWEAHRKYVDIQFIAEGVERIGYANIRRMAVEKEYDGAGDYALLSGDGDFIAMQKGDFMILWPGDAHLPRKACGEPRHVKKVVVKALI